MKSDSKPDTKLPTLEQLAQQQREERDREHRQHFERPENLEHEHLKVPEGFQGTPPSNA